MKFGIFLSDADVLDGSIKASVDAAVRYEKSGFYSVWVNDHFYSPLGSPKSNQLECFTTLIAIAMATTKIKLVPAVSSASFRSPALLAKIISAIDHASDGRFISGLGAGWQDKEYLAHGYDFPSLKVRLEQLDEVIQEQFKQIEILQQQQKQLISQIEGLQPNKDKPTYEKPPHY